MGALRVLFSFGHKVSRWQRPQSLLWLPPRRRLGALGPGKGWAAGTSPRISLSSFR